jgi:flagellar hook-associated protein 3 FlgL
MRATFNAQFRDGQAGIEGAVERLMDAQRQVSTGKRLNKVSDDPAAASASVAERNALGASAQYVRTTDNAGSRLTVIDTVLSDVINKLTEAQGVAISARGTTKPQVARDAAAEHLRGIRAALLDNLNTTFHGTYVFSGASATTQPFTETAGVVNAYAGSTTPQSIDIGDGRSVTTSFNGNTIAQGGDAQHLFDAMDDLIAAIEAGDEPATTVGMDALKRAFDRATAAQSSLGNDMHEVDAQKLRLQQMKISGTERLSKLEEANMAEAISKMSQAETAYQAALGAVSTATRTSLLDYLR